MKIVKIVIRSKLFVVRIIRNVQILLTCGTNTYYGITNDISDFQMSTFAAVV